MTRARPIKFLATSSQLAGENGVSVAVGNTSNTIARRMSHTLQPTIAGDVFVPGDDGYDNARRGFFLNVDQRPSVVVLAESSADVVRAVQFARSHGMRIAPQSTGHGAPPLEPLEDAMLLKTTAHRRYRCCSCRTSLATRAALAIGCAHANVHCHAAFVVGRSPYFSPTTSGVCPDIPR